MELADKMSFPSVAVTVDVNVVFFSSIAIKKKRRTFPFFFFGKCEFMSLCSLEDVQRRGLNPQNLSYF